MNEAGRDEIYRAKVNLETARISWKELQRFFANGTAVYVSEQLDLVEVAFQFSEDNRQKFEEWAAAGLVARVTDAQALSWYESDMDMWAVVVSPWVLVQPAESLETEKDK